MCQDSEWIHDEALVNQCFGLWSDRTVYLELLKDYEREGCICSAVKCSVPLFLNTLKEDRFQAAS